MKIVDTHAHLDMLKDPAECVKRAQAAGVAQIITIGIDLDSSLKAAQLSRELPGVFCTVGLHPHNASASSKLLWSELKRLALTTPAVAVGECGLDYYRNLAPKPLQREAFVRQVELARELGIPLIIHDRDAHDEVLAILREMQAERVGGVIHCFSGDVEVAKKVLDLDFHIGITGVVTFSNASTLREVVKTVPLRRLLLETDAPYLAPEPHRGKTNEPALLVHTLKAVAEILGIDEEEVAYTTSDNARRLFGLPEIGNG